jgi:hypothetical protein
VHRGREEGCSSLGFDWMETAFDSNSIGFACWGRILRLSFDRVGHDSPCPDGDSTSEAYCCLIALVSTTMEQTHFDPFLAAPRFFFYRVSRH